MIKKNSCYNVWTSDITNSGEYEMNKDKDLNVRATSDDIQMLKTLANRNEQSMSEYIRWIINKQYSKYLKQSNNNKEETSK